MRITVIMLSALALLTSCATDGFWKVACNMMPRPQEPKTRPYVIEEIMVDGGSDGVRLAGELTMPEGNGPFPGIVLISGSEIVDRNSKILGHKPFLVLSDFLTRNGYAVFRYDDRGYGKSSGDSYMALDDDFAADAAAAFTWLTGQDKVDAQRSGYIGHSQGAFRSIIAAQTTSPRFLVFLAGGIQPLETLLIDQARIAGVVSGMAPETLNVQEQELRSIFEILHQSDTREIAAERIASWASGQGASDRVSRRLAEAYATPWMWSEIRRSNNLYSDTDEDIAQLLAQFSGPVLAMFGGKDQLVRASANSPLTEPLLRNSHSSVVEIPNANHFFQPANKGGLEEMCEIQTTIDPGVLHIIKEWLQRS